MLLIIFLKVYHILREKNLLNYRLKNNFYYSNWWENTLKKIHDKIFVYSISKMDTDTNSAIVIMVYVKIIKQIRYLPIILNVCTNANNHIIFQMVEFWSYNI